MSNYGVFTMKTKMQRFSEIMVLVTGVVHIWFFKVESLDFTSPKTMSKFGLTQESVQYVAPWAFNQGFYNLFLGLGLFYVHFLRQRRTFREADTLACFILATIFGAALVLYLSVPGKLVPALIQGGPAALAIIFIFIGYGKSRKT
jgi:putative membrane protein